MADDFPAVYCAGDADFPVAAVILVEAPAGRRLPAVLGHKLNLRRYNGVFVPYGVDAERQRIVERLEELIARTGADQLIPVFIVSPKRGAVSPVLHRVRIRVDASRRIRLRYLNGVGDSEIICAAVIGKRRGAVV